MSDPACQEKRWIGHIAGIEAAPVEKIARVIQSHQRHDATAQEINGLNSGPQAR